MTAIILSILGTVCICIPPFIKGKNMKMILLFVFLANALVATSYLLTGAYNGAGSCFVGAAQSIISYFFDSKNKKIPLWLVGIYALSFIAVNMLVFANLRDLIAMLASLCFVLSIVQKNGRNYRIATLVCTLLWITYDLVMLSYGPVITHTIQLVTVISGIVIHDIQKRQTTETPQ